jgi:hypothetical protein
MMASVYTAIFGISTLVFPSFSTAATCPELRNNSHWSDQEHWTWNEICEGREANLQSYAAAHTKAEAQDRYAQNDLSQQFVETILFNEAYRSSIPHQSIRIVGARFPDKTDLSFLKLDGDLYLTYSRFEDSLVMGGAEIRGHLNLKGSSASAGISMDNLHAGELTMDEVNSPSVWLATARIGTQISLSDATVRDQVQMTNLEVGTDLNFLNSTLTKVVLRSAKVGGTLEISGPRRREDPVARSEHCLNNTKPRPHTYPPQSVDLTGATIGTLSLGSFCYGPVDAPNNWGDGAQLILTSTSVHTLRDGLCRDNQADCAQDTWPEHLELTGFTYQELETFDYGREVDMAARPIAWWTDWLRRQRYSLQPYQYLASFFLKVGYKDKAEDILYAGKNRELEQTPFPASIKLWLERALIGYGYRTRYAAMWAVGFIILGGITLRLSGEGLRNGMPYGIAFSFDMLLPIVKLRDSHYDVDLKGWARYYFYIHKLMGYILASFLIAGLTGLTK